MSSELMQSWSERWSGSFDRERFARACTELVDELTHLHRSSGELPEELVRDVFRETMFVLIYLPGSHLPKPRMPHTDPWGLAATQFLFDVIEWCRLSDWPHRSLSTAPPLERNVAVRDYLMAHPNASLREVASGLKLPTTAVNRTPAWRTVAERRRHGNSPRPRGVSFQRIEHAYVADDADELDLLIAEQARDDRSHRVFASERV